MRANRQITDTELAPAQTRVRATLADSFLALLFGLILLNTNSLFVFIDDEVNMLDPAAMPVGAFLGSLGEILRTHQHPPLYDLFLNLWLNLTGGTMAWLRVPSVVFFVAGIFCLSRAAQTISGSESARALIWLAILWPYGFHYGRLAGWYSLVFLLISALTWAYLRYVVAPSREGWVRACVLGILLVYASYMGWALLFLLAADDWVRHRERQGTMKRLATTAAVFVVAYLPLWPAFWNELSLTITPAQVWSNRLLNALYNGYILFVSESVGPWFWWAGIPAAAGIATALLLVFFGIKEAPRRWLAFGALLMAGMAIAGILNPRRLFVFAPWILLPFGVAIGTIERAVWRIGIALALGLVGAAGWYGIYTQRYYGAPRFTEPWETVASETAQAVRSGAIVIGNNPSFFFYLTYALEAPERTGEQWRFSGVLTRSVQHPRVWEPEAWVASGRPISPYLLWVRGMPGPEEGTPMAEARDWLNAHCASRNVRYLARDPGYEWKQQFAPEPAPLLWRIELREYSCDSAQTSPASPAAAP
jgi:hypothetical protein